MPFCCDVQDSGALGTFVGSVVRGATQKVTPIPEGLGPYGGKSTFDVLIYANDPGEHLASKCRRADLQTC